MDNVYLNYNINSNCKLKWIILNIFANVEIFSIACSESARFFITQTVTKEETRIFHIKFPSTLTAKKSSYIVIYHWFSKRYTLCPVQSFADVTKSQRYNHIILP